MYLKSVLICFCLQVVNNLVNLDTERLVYLFCDVKGSYVANAYFESVFIGERSREKMIWKLKVTKPFK